MPGSKLLECSEVLVLNQSGLIFMLNDYIYNKNNKHLNLSKFPQTLPKDSKTQKHNNAASTVTPFYLYKNQKWSSAAHMDLFIFGHFRGRHSGCLGHISRSISRHIPTCQLGGCCVNAGQAVTCSQPWHPPPSPCPPLTAGTQSLTHVGSLPTGHSKLFHVLVKKKIN